MSLEEYQGSVYAWRTLFKPAPKAGWWARFVARLLVFVLVVGGTVYAQGQVASSNKFAWDQPAPDLASAQGYTYKYYADGATTGVVLTGVTCTGATPITCNVSIPAFTPGSHTIQFTVTNIAGESAKSAPFAFVFVVVPGAPVNIRIQ